MLFRSCCGEQPGPTDPKPGIHGPGGGRIGTLVIGRCVRQNHKDATPYNHYSLLRSLEDLYGLRTGGTDGKGHLGYAAAAGLKSFGKDLFAHCTKRPIKPASYTAAAPMTSDHGSAVPADIAAGLLAAGTVSTAAVAVGRRRVRASRQSA